MWIAQTVADCRARRAELKSPVAFVPTMGALHEGHMSLVREARKLADHVIVSVFVNPTQFGPTEDFHRYPRPLERDLELCRAEGVTGVFNPPIDQIYPAKPGEVGCSITVPSLAGVLEGEIRPTHFAGVCRVVAKLFNIVTPDVAVFGRKDYQQWRIIEAMTTDLMMPIRIVGAPTLREPDGLAMSSRNVYLSPEARLRACGLYKALSEAKQMVEVQEETDPAAVERTMFTILKAHHIEPQYAVIRHPLTLEPLDSISPNLTHGVVGLIAGTLDNVRLIDNMLMARGA